MEEMFEAIEQDGEYRARYDADDGHPTFFRLGQPEVDAGSDHHVLWLRHANIKIQ
ncbi:MAG: hypothetical protein SGI90_14115 [Candidatus Eisenbacteria bacterium]|nr:hypothetical protein [Candidatus Eisenbacteria bacterium]